jgi:UPF0271 protein
MSVLRVDLNADLGEGTGREERLMALVTSANIACGGHAGDGSSMREAVILALEHGVSVGSHPGLEDRVHFGRRMPPEGALGEAEVRDLIRRQHEALAEVAGSLGVQVRHLKLHGVLYHLASLDLRVASGVLAALSTWRPVPALVCLAGSVLERRAREWGGVRVVPEGFADRSYLSDGSLTPRTEAGALLSDPGKAAEQVLGMLREGRVRAADGSVVALRPETICVHGDGGEAEAMLRGVRHALEEAGVAIQRFETGG